MEYHSKDIKESLHRIALRLSNFSLNNIEWGCLYSGVGIIHILSDKEVNKIFSKFKTEEKKTLLDNLVTVKCLYKKAKPSFGKPPEEVLNPGKYMWDFTSFNKEILPSSQAFGILCLCRAAELHSKTNQILGTVMVRNAEIYYEFASTYLRNDDGLFVSAEDKTKFINDDINIKQSKSAPKLMDQVMMHEALLALHAITSRENISCYKSHKSETYLNEAKSIFKYLFSSYDLMLESSSRDISQIVSSLARCCHISADPESRVNYCHIIALLCAELESRIKITGEVEKNPKDLEPASLITHFRAASALMEGFFETGIEKFRDISLRIYRFLEDLFDYSLNLFILGDYRKIGYSARDIAEVLKAMLLYYSTDKDTRLLDMITRFYEAAIENSGIVQGVPSHKLSLEGFEDMMQEAEGSTKAPVFMKSFRINMKKSSACTVSDYFSSNHSLYLSYIALYYFSPLTFHDETEKLENEELINK